MKRIALKSGREAAILRRSPWVFSGGIAREDEDITDGELVALEDHRGNRLGVGHYQAGSIRLRVLHFGPDDPSETLFRDRISEALTLRRKLGLIDDPLTNAYRLVHAAGDGLPGLIIDVYGTLAVLQCHSIGMHLQRDALAEIVLDVLGGTVETVYDKSSAVLPDRYALEIEDGIVSGPAVTEIMALENGRRFIVDAAGGQKTGFFLDQRDNRWLLGSYCADARVGNLFCYTGGFSVYALLGGAAHVDSVDLSQSAIDITQRNVGANGDFADRHRAYAADVMQWLKDEAEDRSYDVIICDPPAYAKNKHKRHKAVQAYKRLNARAMQKIKPGGLLFTFSCSRVVDRQLFYDTIVAAGLEANRPVRLLHHLGQSPDHPVNLFHPDSEYLKGMVLEIG